MNEANAKVLTLNLRPKPIEPFPDTFYSSQRPTIWEFSMGRAAGRAPELGCDYARARAMKKEVLDEGFWHHFLLQTE